MQTSTSMSHRPMWTGKRTSVYVPGRGWRVKPPQQQQQYNNRHNLNSRTNLLFTDLEEDKVHYCASIDCGSFAIPHPQKQEKGGEDSHFTFGKSEQGSGKVYSLTMGVADGVSGWAADGVDPALYARELSLHGEVAAKNSGIFEDDPYNILDYAHSNSLSLGSSTCTIANITSRTKTKGGVGKGIALLKWTTVGDSGVKVFRRGMLIAQSPVMEHYFNCPRQLANPKLVQEGDTPAIAQDAEVELRKGDAIVLATDGVFDNMYDKDLGEIVAQSRRQSASSLAEKIARTASMNARNPKYLSPFSKEANALEVEEETNPVVRALTSIGVVKEKNPYMGGKLDDITVVVAVVNEV